MPFMVHGERREHSDWLAQLRATFDREIYIADGGAIGHIGAFMEEVEQPITDQFTLEGTVLPTDETGVDVSRTGSVLLATAAVAGGDSRLRGKAGKRILGGGNTEPWVFAVKARIVSAVTAQTRITMGLTDGANAIQAVFGLRGDLSTVAWYVQNNAAATATGGTFDGTKPINFALLNDKTNLRLFVNDTQTGSFAGSYVQVAQVATSIAGSSLKWLFEVLNGTDAVVRSFRVDKIAVLVRDRLS